MSKEAAFKMILVMVSEERVPWIVNGGKMDGCSVRFFGAELGHPKD